MSRNRLYSTILVACVGGFIWLWMQYPPDLSSSARESGACLVKNITGVPCPSCGTTRSVFELLDGNILTSIQWNPMGILVLLIMVISPFWILSDFLFKRESFLRFYGQAEKQLQSKWFAIPAIGLVIANWGWNILKGL